MEKYSFIIVKRELNMYRKSVKSCLTIMILVLFIVSSANAKVNNKVLSNNIENDNLQKISYGGVDEIINDAMDQAGDAIEDSLNGVNFNMNDDSFGSSEVNKDYGNKNLKNANFAGKRVTNVNFKKTNLQWANFSNARLTNAEFDRANLSDANLHKADLINASFKDTNLSCANLSYSNLLNADFIYSNLSKAILYRTNLTNADFEGVNFSNMLIDKKSYASILGEDSKNYEFKKLTENDIYRLPGYSKETLIELVRFENQNKDLGIVINKVTDQRN